MDDLSIKNISDMPDHTRGCIAYPDVIPHILSPVQIATLCPGEKQVGKSDSIIPRSKIHIKKLTGRYSSILLEIWYFALF